MTTFDILFGLVTLCVSAFLQGVTGFGFALVAVPLLSSFLLPQEIVPLVVVYCLGVNTVMFLKNREHVRFSQLKILMPFGILGIPFGVWSLNVMDALTIKAIVSVLIILTAIFMLKGKVLNLKHEKVTTAFTGFLSGFLNGSTSLSGPPVVIFMANQKAGKDSFRANLPTYGILLNLITLVAFIFDGKVTAVLMKKVLFLSPGVILGLLLSFFVVGKINEGHFRRITLMLILCTGAYTLLTVILS